MSAQRLVLVAIHFKPGQDLPVKLAKLGIYFLNATEVQNMNNMKISSDKCFQRQDTAKQWTVKFQRDLLHSEKRPKTGVEKLRKIVVTTRM